MPFAAWPFCFGCTIELEVLVVLNNKLERSLQNLPQRATLKLKGFYDQSELLIINLLHSNMTKTQSMLNMGGSY